MRRIVVIDGHPDVSGERYLHALAEAYAVGAASAGHEVRVIRVAALDFPIIRTREEWEHQKPPADIVEAQDAVKWAQHVVLLYPLWLGDVPALLKGFLEQLSRPGFAFEYDNRGGTRTLLDGRSARVIVTMGMPAPFYSWFYRAHSLKSLERNVLKMIGFGAVRHSLIGMVEGSAGHRERWLDRIRELGRRAR
jgi:putative NADPH-quinone reductase